ncbi:MAG: DUF455 family protein [Verrucomicrobiota bacterium JB023]|nr:DUF455 family protein [Verrucomicrobiota bacterium JB023]
MTTVRDFAERVLLTNSLEEKLSPPPAHLTIDPPSKQSFRAPDLPGRPDFLLPRKPSEGRTKIPSANQLANEDHRSTLLHFFCNHELLAVELMALALLKFPDAPDAFRRGLLRTLKEEQEHTRLYLDRMSAAGVSFGEHSLSRMIWDHIAGMESPIEYVSRLSLTFEQANLDYARHYGEAFARVGDEASAELLNRIYKDEIAHVGYGLTWLRRFKEQKESDWSAWHRSLAFPLSPVRAKGPEPAIPFNEEGRRKAGLTDEFIKKLQLYQRSRGRTPVVHWFNPNCEAHALAEFTGMPFFPRGAAHELEHDLEALMLANAVADDVVLMREVPGESHQTLLKQAGFVLPEMVKARDNDLATRKLGGFAPWAWSPDASERFRSLREQVTSPGAQDFREAFPPRFFSKALTSPVAAAAGLLDNESYAVSSTIETLHLISQLEKERGWTSFILKPAFSCAGRGQLRFDADTDPISISNWLRAALSQQTPVILEPLLPRLLDFSILYDASSSGIRFVGFTLMEVDESGRYLGTTVAPKFASLLSSEFAREFHQPIIKTEDGDFTAPDFYRERLPRSLEKRYPGYTGPLAVDAFFYRKPSGSVKIRPVVEVNARCSMGRIAHNLRHKLDPKREGTLRIHRKSDPWPKGALPLNDPAKARRFIATWTMSP